MNVKEVQKRLWEQSREHKEHREASRPLFPTNPYEKRVRNLMDLIHQPDWLRAAMEKTLARSKGKAAGVDGVTAYKFMRRALESKLEELRQELRNGTYQPKPLRRVMIPKANGKMRPLGIPCIRDKIVQEAIRMALEPIFEVEFHENSYGFRPNRSAHHAVFRCQQMMKLGFTWVANDFVSDDEFDRLLDGWFGNISRALLPGHGFYIWGGYANLANYPPMLKKHGLYFSQCIVWNVRLM
ncbi:MAG: reverse transcriptase domain-containing protein [Thermoguttaceae bacterium]